ncbi:alpha/beta-hydrolase [Myriangium duriaei CBS 260.36]|uniref:Alpha/beta-hydrolase n=1 Tax=Myriangium duriaei CBS 260.36 TaxID=1168546 RepID=A0A9P4MGJ6_9PEZI|nr:alpha/beta-hydrolase [Myriangium duriaei CBS 260.36]
MKTFVTSRLTRRTAATSARGSANASASVNVDSARNSRGASTNLAEISETLDNLINRLTESERLSIGEENVARRLQRLCEQYPQSHVPELLPEWQRSQDTLDVVRVAADCAESVYERKCKAAVPGISLHPNDYEFLRQIAATANGDFKATTIRIHRLSRTLVIAVRGTKKTSPIDWITNANGEPIDATAFLPGLPQVKAHGGFLCVAQRMAADILRAISSYVGSYNRICFTGHSAGAAVASLLYLHYQLSRSLDIPTDCITFAMSPVLSFPIGSAALGSATSSLTSLDTRFLAIVAHGDPVPRADRPFVRQILQIYSNVSDTPLQNFQFDPPELYSAGDLVVLFDKNLEGDEEEIVAVKAEDGIGEFLWGTVKMHEMEVYLKLLSQLRQE